MKIRKSPVNQVRLNRYISESGITSRRKAEDFILEGRVSINNKIVTDLSFKVIPGKDVVCLDGEKINPKRHLYFLLNKPKGVVTTTNDEKKRKTVIDILKTRERVFPVGRLDYNTTGVLLLTNDGDFSNFLMHPKNSVPREYEVKLDKPLSEEDKARLLKGIYINGKKGIFNKAFFPKNKDKKFVIVTTVEGRNHFVKNMFKALNYTVITLNRKTFAGITADIPLGAYRELTQTEIMGVIKNYGG